MNKESIQNLQNQSTDNVDTFPNLDLGGTENTQKLNENDFWDNLNIDTDNVINIMKSEGDKPISTKSTKKEEEVIKDPLSNDNQKEDIDKDEQKSKKEDDLNNKDKEEEDDVIEYDKTALQSFTQELVESKFLDLDDKAISEIKTPQDLISIAEENIQKKIDNGINEYKNIVSNRGAKFLEYLENGGDEDTYIDTLNTANSYKDADISTEDGQVDIIAHYLQLRGIEDSIIQSHLQRLKNEDKLSEESHNIKNTLVQYELQQLQELEEKQAQQRKEYIESVNNQRKTIIKELNEIKDYNGISFNKVNKQELANFMFRTDKDGVTDFEKKISNIINSQDKQDIPKYILLARILKNDFNLKDILNDLETTVVRKVKKDFDKHYIHATTKDKTMTNSLKNQGDDAMLRAVNEVKQNW